jgi:IstB-like ATP binding protein
MSTPSPSAGTSIVDNNALTGALRTLKLGGMLQTLDARLAQARAGELGHLEFLQVLCLDEISRRDTTAIARRTRRARFEQTVTLEGFDFTANPKLPAAQIRDLAALRWLNAGESVILHGPTVICGLILNWCCFRWWSCCCDGCGVVGGCGWLSGPAVSGEFAAEVEVLAVGSFEGGL